MKKIIAMLLVLVMVLSLVACGNKADEKTTVTMIAAQYGDKTAEWWAGFEKKFEEANADIDLVVDVVSWNDIYTVVNTRIANNEQPDLLNIDGFADYHADGLLKPVSEWVSDETYAKFYDSFIAESIVDGTVWAIPDLASARALYVNTDILAAAGVEVPTTWAELEKACEAIKAYDPEIYPWGVDMTTDEGQAAFAYYTWNNGGGFVDKDGNWALNSAENVEAIEFIIDMVNKGYTNNDPANQTRYTLQDLFAAGKIAMMIAPTQIESICAEAGNGVNFKAVLIPANEARPTLPWALWTASCASRTSRPTLRWLPSPRSSMHSTMISPTLSGLLWRTSSPLPPPVARSASSCSPTWSPGSTWLQAHSSIPLPRQSGWMSSRAPSMFCSRLCWAKTSRPC